MKLSDLIKKNTKYYEYIIRTVVPLTDENIDCLAECYRRFHLLEIEGPNETIFQDKPLDFYELGPSKVWWIKIKTNLPASLVALQELTKNVLKVVERQVVVRSAIGFDEVTVNQDLINTEISLESDRLKLVQEPLTANEFDYAPEKNIPNSPDYLKQLFYKHQKERSEQLDKYELPNKMFVWLKIPELEIKVPENPDSDVNVTNVGNLTDNLSLKKRFYDPLTGKLKELGD
jgi:hypothetical protein